MSVLPLYRNQSIDLHSKSIDWFLCEGNTGISWVNPNNRNDARNICYHNPVWYLKIRLDECHEGQRTNSLKRRLVREIKFPEGHIFDFFSVITLVPKFPYCISMRRKFIQSRNFSCYCIMQ